MSEFKDKKVLLIGLGILGGGVSISNWLIKEGAKLTIFDSKTKDYLKDSIRQIKGKVNFIFEKCDDVEVKKADIIVINQAVPKTNPQVVLAEKLGKPIYNESKIFYSLCSKPIIAITGTRGKTTTTNWTNHLLGNKSLIAGNSVKEPLLKILPKTKNKKNKIIVNEIPSFQLERFDSVPCISVITNIFVDHLNRHGTMENYALAKANIFKYQNKNNFLILNDENDWTDFFIKQKPKADIWFFSTKTITGDKKGLYYKDGYIYIKNKKTEKVLDIRNFIKNWGKHNLENLLSSALAVYLAGEKWIDIKKRIKNIPQIKYRQELVKKYKKTSIINDTSATSPEGGMAAIERFSSPSCILITGGTDAGLDYRDWAKTLIKHIPIKNLIFLDGSATKKMLTELNKYMDTSKISIKNTLKECVDLSFEKVKNIKTKSVILFSPSAKSFEKFKNEFDRGEKFNKLIKNKTGQ